MTRKIFIIILFFAHSAIAVETDLEALGLDNVDDKKNTSENTINKYNKDNKNHIYNKYNVYNKDSVLSRISDLSNNPKNKLEKIKNKTPAKPLNKAIKQSKKKILKKSHNDNFAKKNTLKNLREKYKVDFEGDKKNLTSEEKLFSDKDRFLTYDLPPPPILDRNRDSENKHIPTIPTPQERIDDMFLSITSRDGAYFNATYNYVKNPNATNDVGETILTRAILLQNHAVVASILAKGANPDIPNKLGHTPFDIAIEMMDMRSAKILADMNADLSYKDGFDRTYLMHGSRVGFLPMVDFLVSRGVDVNEVDTNGITALSIAYRHKKDIIVKFLLKRGAKTWVEKPFNPSNQSIIKELETRWKK
jgi:ankyrin repeat protein